MRKKIQLLLFVAAAFTQQTATAQWNQVGTDLVGVAYSDVFGRSLSMSGDGSTIAIGAGQSAGSGTAGSVRIYQNMAGTWTQLGIDISGDVNGENTGSSVSISDDGTKVVIGAPQANSYMGRVRVYEYFGGGWSQMGVDIPGDVTNSFSGTSVSMSDDGLTIAIGTPWDNGSGAYEGRVQIFTYAGGAWTQVGSDIYGEAANDQSGQSVSISGDGSIVAIGAIGNDANGTDAGQVRVYENIASTWTQIGADIDGEAAGDNSGKAISLSADGSTVAIGSSLNDGNGSNSGHVRVFKNITGTWTQVGSDIDGDNVDDWSGGAVSISDDGTTLAIGAAGSDANGASSGHARVMKLVSGTWTQEGADLNGENAGDAGGFAVALNSDGSYVANGIYDYGINVGKVKIYKTCKSTSIDTQTACETFDWVDGNTYTSSNNTATHVVNNAAGCDSTITLNLTINPLPDASTTVAGETITATQAGATYIWVDCDNGNTPIPNETSQSFTPLVTGNYAVRIILNGCSVTSDCVALTVVGIDENSLDNSISVFPNPSKGKFNIELSHATEVRITNALGVIVKTQDCIAGKNQISLNEAPNGLYFVQIQDNNNTLTTKVILHR